MLRIKPDSAILARHLEQQKYVPLKRVSIEASIRSFAADVTIKQVFRNDETTPIEAVYCFPIEEQAAVYAFVARIDDREIVAELKEKEDAQKEYNDALRQGYGAYLLEQDETSQDNFVINVGALPPGKECQIEISYVSELDLVQNRNKIRFVIPTTIAPRYNPEKGGISSPANTTSKYVQTSPYTIEFCCRVDKVGITSVSSTSHPIQVDLGQQDAYVITFAQKNTHLDRDILVDIDLVENRSNTIIAVEPGAVMVSFTPSEEDCQYTRNNVETTNEFIFVVDCSGSMRDENKIGLARQAMLLFLKSLPVDTHFNIVRFGSSHTTLFNDVTAVYNKENARKAEELTNQMQADLGGTELLSPLQWLEEHPPGKGRARQIFLLTDGEISKVDQVLDLCRSMATSARIFSFGLGRSPSRSLVRGLARATNGRFVFIPPNSSVDIHVGEQLQKALQASITNVKIQWNLGTSVMSAPTKVPPIYVNDRLIIYALADDPTSVFVHNSSVELYTNKYRISKAKVTRVPNVSNEGTIARLAAKALILELQHSKLPEKNIVGSLQKRFQKYIQAVIKTTVDEKLATKKRIIQISLKHKILSPHTAFVGIEKRANASNVDMVLREVPIQISADDQHVDTSHFMGSHGAQQCMMLLGSSAMPMVRESSVGSRIDGARYNSYATSNLKKAKRSLECMTKRLMYEEEDSESMDDELSDLDDLDMCVSMRSAIETEEQDFSTTEKQDIWPTGDQNIVRYLINKQNFDGLWDLDTKNIEQLTGKPLAKFPQSNNPQILISAIVLVALETRFASLSTMWHGVVQKARKRLLDLLGKDQTKLESLVESIRQQL